MKSQKLIIIAASLFIGAVIAMLYFLKPFNLSGVSSSNNSSSGLKLMATSNVTSSPSVLFWSTANSNQFYLITVNEENTSLVVWALPSSLILDGRATPKPLSDYAAMGGLSEVRQLLADNGIKTMRQMQIGKDGLEAALSICGRLTFNNPEVVGDSSTMKTPVYPVGKLSLAGFQAVEYFSAAPVTGSNAATAALIELLVSKAVDETRFTQLLELFTSDVMAADRLNGLAFMEQMSKKDHFVTIIQPKTVTVNGGTALTPESLSELKSFLSSDVKS